jgi:hypothetical protein
MHEAIGVDEERIAGSEVDVRNADEGARGAGDAGFDLRSEVSRW